MKKRYDKKYHKEQFVETTNFCVPLEYYLELSEKKRKYMYLNTKMVLQHMVLVEENTYLIRKGLSENRTLELARSVIAIADAFKEHICTSAGKISESANDEAADEVDEILEHQGWDEFRKYRFVKAYSSHGDDASNITEAHQEVQQSVRYTERGVIFDYIYESWKQAVLNKDSDWSVNESIDAVNTKASYQQKQQDRMKAYVGHLKGAEYNMLDGR